MLVSSKKVCETANLQGVRPRHAAQHFILPLQGLHAIHMGDTVVNLWCLVPMKQASASPRQGPPGALRPLPYLPAPEEAPHNLLDLSRRITLKAELCRSSQTGSR